MSLSIPRLEQQKNGYFYILWTENRVGKRISTKTKNVKEAKLRLADFLMDSSQGVPVDVPILIGHLFDRYFTSHVERNCARNTQDRIVRNWRLHLAPHFGNLDARKLSWAIIDVYIEKRSKGVLGRKAVGSTIRMELHVLKACLNWCADKARGFIKPEEVLLDFETPCASAPKDVWLTEDEISLLLDAEKEKRINGKPTRLERFIFLAYHTGGRKTSILNLSWDQVDFVTKKVHFHRSGEAKTSKKNPSVWMSTSLEKFLAECYQHRVNDLVLENLKDVNRELTTLVKKCGLTKHVTPHTFRHSIATNLAREGISMKGIAEFLGNSEELIIKTYAKHSPVDLRDAIRSR
jgi:integrase